MPKDFIKQYEKFKAGEYGTMTSTGFAKMLEIGRATLYKYIEIYKSQAGK